MSHDGIRLYAIRHSSIHAALKHDDHGYFAVVGDRGTGRRSLVRQALHEGRSTAAPVSDPPSHLREYFEKGVSLGGVFFQFRLSVLDQGVLGNEQLGPDCWRDTFAEACLVVFDLTDRKSFDSGKEWLKEANRYLPDAPKILVGNKADLVAERAVSRAEAEELIASFAQQKKLEVMYFETTATDRDSARAPFKYLMKQHCKQFEGDTPLHRAAFKGQIGRIHAIVKAEEIPIDAGNAKGRPPLHRAAQAGQACAVETLIRMGSRAMDESHLFGTPMHVAALRGHVSVIETLVRSGSKAIDSFYNSRDTPMHFAAVGGHVNAIEALLRLGSKAIDACDTFGWTPMHVAAYHGNGAAIEKLVRLGSQSLDSQDPYEDVTPLHVAACNGQAAAVQTLVRLGSKSIETPTRFGHDPIYYAAANSHWECVRLLLAVIADPLNTVVRLRSRVYPSDYDAAKLLPETVKWVVVSPGPKGRRPMRSTLPRDFSVTLDDVLEMRYQIYFAPTLAYRMLLLLSEEGRSFDFSKPNSCSLT